MSAKAATMASLRTKRLAWVLVAMAAVCGAGFALFAQMHRALSLPDPAVELDGEATSFPMTIAEGRPIVELRINNSGPYRFIFDTGAEGTVISPALSDSLNLPVLGHARVGSPGKEGTAEANLVRLGTVQFGKLNVSQMTAVAVDLSTMPKVFSVENAPVGVLSIRNWKGVLVTLNYPASRIEIRRGELPPPDNEEIFAFDAQDRLPSIVIKVAGTPVRANLDSGAARGIVLPAELQTRVPTIAAPVEVEGVRTLGGLSRTASATLRGAVQIGSYSLDGPEVNFVDGMPVGNLGYPVLQNFVVTLDWQNHRVQLHRP